MYCCNVLTIYIIVYVFGENANSFNISISYKCSFYVTAC